MGETPRSFIQHISSQQKLMNSLNFYFTLHVTLMWYFAGFRWINLPSFITGGTISKVINHSMTFVNE